MTVSEKEREENLNHAIRVLMGELADRAISQVFFTSGSEAQRSVLPTTWKELCDQGWLEEVELYGDKCYRLTGSGWLECLWRTGVGKKKEFLDGLGTLMAAFKRYVKGRQKDVVVEFERLVADSGLSPGQVFNVIESAAIEKLLRRHGAKWQERGVLVRIPLHFGLELLDHSGDIRAELKKLQEDLESAREELKEFHCSFCGAPIDAQGTMSLSEDVDGYYIAYACGRYETDGYGARPCPSDPQFPKFEEYELQFVENPKEPSLKWTCYARPMTKAAQQAHIDSGLGRTREEAETRVVESYRRISRKY